MAKLYFKVASDWEEVVKLRNEIAKLQQELKGMNAAQSPAAFNALNTQLSASTQQFNGLVMKAAQAGAVIEGDFKKKIFDASQSVNAFTEKIIAQKDVVKRVEADVKRLGEAYSAALKNKPFYASSKLSDYTSARRTLDEEKAALFGLTQEQASARLSVKKLRDEYALYKDESKGVVSANDNMGLSLGKALGVIGGVAALKKLGSEIVRVRGEFQSMQTAIETLVGKDMAGNLMPQIKELAKVSPLALSDMVGAEKMMLGFNVKAEDTIRYLQALSDISMGNSQKFNSLTLAFSQMSASGKLMGQDLNQMINAGFNPLQAISEKTGKSIATLKDEMSKGAVSADMVQQAFIDATSAGGKFYQMSENASKTINGQISMMQDALDNAFNEMGQASEGFIMSGIQATTSLIQNYETVGKVLLALIEVYGVYRSALIFNAVLEQGSSNAIWTKIKATKAAAAAQAVYNKVMMMNPYVAIGAAVISLGLAMWTLADHTSAAEKAQKRYNERKEEAKRLEDEHKRKIDSLIESIRDIALSDIQRGQSLAELRKVYPKIFEQYDIESIKLADILKLKQQINDEDGRRVREKEEKEFSDINNEIVKLEKFLSTMSGQQGVDGYVDKLKQLRLYRDALLQDKGKSISEQFILSLKDIDISEFDHYISELEKRIKGKGEDGRVKLRLPIDVKGSLSDEAIYGVKDIKTLIDTAKSSKQTRIDTEKNKTTYKQDFDKAKKDWEEAKKKLADIEKDKSKFTVKQYEEAKKLKESTEKSFKDIGGATGGVLTKQESAAKKQKKEQEKYNEDILSLRRKNQQDEISLMKDGTEKKLAQIGLDYQKEIDAIKKEEKELNKNRNGKLTKEQSDNISARYTNAQKKRDKDISDVVREELEAEQQALNDYLKEYGTFQQQKLAITEEYASKIKKAQERGAGSAQIKLLEKQRDTAIQNKEVEALKADIDWVTVFGEFGGMFNDMIKPALEKAKKYIQTADFKNSDQASQKTLIDAINQMEKSIDGAGGLNFKKLGQDLQTYQNALLKLNNAKEEEIAAISKLKKAQEDYNKAIKSGTESEKQAAKDALDTAQQNADAASINVKSQTDVVNQTGQGLSDTATTLKANMDDVTDGLSKMASGGLKSAYDGLIQAGKGMGGAFEKVTEKIEDVPIIGWVVAIVDIFKDGLSNVVGGLLDAVLNAASGIIGDVLSGDLFVTIGKSLRDGIGKIFDAISFGGWSSLMDSINGSNAKEVAKTTERLTNRNEMLQQSIDALKDEMEKARGAETVHAYDESVKKQKELIENTGDILAAQMGYHNSHKSNNYYIGKDISQSDWQKISKETGKRVTNMDQLWNLSPEELKKVSTLTDVWDKIYNGGKYDKREYLDQYIELAGVLDELEKGLQETLTQVTFDSVYDSFVDTLMDMDASTEDFADNLSEYFMRAMLSNQIGKEYADKLQEWYAKFAENMKDGTLDENERKALKDEYMGYVDAAIKERNELASVIGYEGNSPDTSQSASGKGFQTMSQDVGNEISGRVSALQMSSEELKIQNAIQTQEFLKTNTKLDAIATVNTSIKDIADEIRTIQVNSLLQLQDINENTGSTVKHLKKMSERLEKIEKNTSKL